MRDSWLWREQNNGRKCGHCVENSLLNERTEEEKNVDCFCLAKSVKWLCQTSLMGHMFAPQQAMGKDAVATSATQHHQMRSKLIRSKVYWYFSVSTHFVDLCRENLKVFSTKVCDLKHTYCLRVPVIRWLYILYMFSIWYCHLQIVIILQEIPAYVMLNSQYFWYWLFKVLLLYCYLAAVAQ